MSNAEIIEKITALNNNELIGRLADWMQGGDTIPTIDDTDCEIDLAGVKASIADAIKTTLADLANDGLLTPEADDED